MKILFLIAALFLVGHLSPANADTDGCYPDYWWHCEWYPDPPPMPKPPAVPKCGYGGPCNLTAQVIWICRDKFQDYGPEEALLNLECEEVSLSFCQWDLLMSKIGFGQ